MQIFSDQELITKTTSEIKLLTHKVEEEIRLIKKNSSSENEFKFKTVELREYGGKLGKILSERYKKEGKIFKRSEAIHRVIYHSKCLVLIEELGITRSNKPDTCLTLRRIWK